MCSTTFFDASQSFAVYGEKECDSFSGATWACPKTLLGMRVPGFRARVMPRITFEMRDSCIPKVFS